MITRFRPRHATGVLLAAVILVAGCGCTTPELPLVEDEVAPTPAPVTRETTTTQTTTTTTRPTDVPGGSLTVGIDPLTGGFNPHLAANRTEFVMGLAELVLPSTFTDGAMNTDLLLEAKEIPPAEGSAQTVRYVINPQAQWSDGTPVTGSDFIYLWRGITTTPDAVGAAAYRSITAIRTTDAGMTVDVDFAQPVAVWREMFDHLLPSHLLPQADTDFGSTLAGGIPASAGRYSVAGVDRLRGNVTLNRNDRFWGEKPATTDTITFVEIHDTTTAADMLRAGQMSAADLTPGQTSAEELTLIDGTGVTIAPGVGMQLNLSLSVSSPVLDDPALRRAFTNLIDPAQVARLATGRTTLVTTPADPFGTPVHEETEQTPPPPEPGDGIVQARLAELDRPLVIAAEATDDTATAAANIMVDQLALTGVEARVVRATADAVTGQLLPAGEVDAYVSWQPVVTSENLLADRYLCPSAPADKNPPTTTPSATGEPTVTRPGPGLPDDSDAARTGNLSGFCNRQLDGELAELLAGKIPLPVMMDRLRAVETEQVLTVPILADTRLWVKGKEIIGVEPFPLAGDTLFDTAPRWISRLHGVAPEKTEL